MNIQYKKYSTLKYANVKSSCYIILSIGNPFIVVVHHAVFLNACSSLFNLNFIIENIENIATIVFVRTIVANDSFGYYYSFCRERL